MLHNAVLACHPETASQIVQGMEARVEWRQGRALALAYVLKGDISRLGIPPARPPRRADRLWEHTCFEAFIAIKGRPGYHEFNFAPSGEWAASKFRRYREGAPLGDEDFEPSITIRIAGDSLELGALVRLDRLPGMQRNVQLRLGLSAVIEDKHGRLSYWALKHPSSKPDFHHSDAFVLELAPALVDAVNDPAYTGKV